MLDRSFWKNKKVFLTGHTGFKGSWMCILLEFLGAHVCGFALAPPTQPSLFNDCRIENSINNIIGDIRDYQLLYESIQNYEPDIVIHMAAQPLVRESYKIPRETFEINIMGTVNLLDCIKNTANMTKAVINITTDKCYENNEWFWGYRENDPLGGHDPYSSSKACSELVTSAYRNSFFMQKGSENYSVAIASVRAGNVIGGGDWAKDRLIPDCIRALLNSDKIAIRNPDSIRPWQHVLEPLTGYLLLAENLYKQGTMFTGAWNFGPNDEDAQPVEWIVKNLCEKWNDDSSYIIEKNIMGLHEANYLKLDCSKAKNLLKWSPKWNLNQAIEKIVEWALCYKDNKNTKEICQNQIEEFLNT